MRIKYIASFILLLSFLTSCDKKHDLYEESPVYLYDNILDMSYTPNDSVRTTGCFTDAGSWMGFTLPEKNNWINGFCGPFSLDMYRRQWMAKSAVVVSYEAAPYEQFTPDSVNYFPGELYLSASSSHGTIKQKLNFIDASIALLSIQSDVNKRLLFTGDRWASEVEVTVEKNCVVAKHPSNEYVILTFTPNVTLTKEGNNYKATTNYDEENLFVTIAFATSQQEILAIKQRSTTILDNPFPFLKQNKERWEGYLSKVIRKDMPYEYDRIAVKAIVTLISNWRVQRGDLLHEGIVPSHGVAYFVGFWAWDSWRFSAAMANFAPELAKNNIRAMFDYQLPDGMVIDCIYTDASENNARDSKPPLVSWAVNEIFEQNNDTAFVKEMYPQLLSYYKWWYNKRDQDNNGICEYGSTDGTIEAAAWESGMDNAIRFDDSQMLKNKDYDDAWSFNQESVDLNAYLAMECRLLKKFATIINAEFDAPDYSDNISDYFFDKDSNFFFDKKLGDGSFVKEYGCEAYTPLWTQTATPDQVASMLPILSDTTKFSTFIPFPTVAADNPKYNPRGYWRGPIWLDQTYFAIRGLRNYGYNELADAYTLQVFDRLNGLKEGAPIHENYDTHTGARLKAPHFSWSSSHLLMLYTDYKKVLDSSQN